MNVAYAGAEVVIAAMVGVGVLSWLVTDYD